MHLPFQVSEEKLTKDLLELNGKLLTAIVTGDWKTYQDLCSSELTCFEPEANEHQIKGLDFHKFFFPPAPVKADIAVHMANPHVRFLGEDFKSCVISYTRVMQTNPKNYKLVTFQETRVWQMINGKWLHVHFHKSKL